MTTQTERTPLRVVPHFSRLQEWIALDEGFFQAEGLEREMLQEVMHAVSSHVGHLLGQALHFAEHWGLHTHVRESRYDRLIMPVGI
jgi:hypothetical protein